MSLRRRLGMTRVRRIFELSISGLAGGFLSLSKWYSLLRKADKVFFDMSQASTRLLDISKMALATGKSWFYVLTEASVVLVCTAGLTTAKASGPYQFSSKDKSLSRNCHRV